MPVHVLLPLDRTIEDCKKPDRGPGSSGPRLFCLLLRLSFSALRFLLTSMRFFLYSLFFFPHALFLFLLPFYLLLSVYLILTALDFKLVTQLLLFLQPLLLIASFPIPLFLFSLLLTL